MATKTMDNILHFIHALEKSGNRQAVLLFIFNVQTQPTSPPAEQATGSSGNPSSSSNQPSSSRPHDSATQSKPGSSGNNP
jgi:hypothetical protein